MIAKLLVEWGRANYRSFPWRLTADPYKIFVAEVLLQQTFVQKVVPVFEKVISKYPTVDRMAQARVNDLQEIIYSLGLPNRVKRLVDVSKTICERKPTGFPQTYKELIKIKGIGEYTASCIACFAFGESVPIIDTNVLRVIRRLFGTCQHSTNLKPDSATVSKAKELLNSHQPQNYNWAMLDFAALNCKHYQPLCESCVLNQHCNFYQASIGSAQENRNEDNMD